MGRIAKAATGGLERGALAGLWPMGYWFSFSRWRHWLPLPGVSVRTAMWPCDRASGVAWANARALCGPPAPRPGVASVWWHLVLGTPHSPACAVSSLAGLLFSAPPLFHCTALLRAPGACSGRQKKAGPKRRFSERCTFLPVSLFYRY